MNETILTYIMSIFAVIFSLIAIYTNISFARELKKINEQRKQEIIEKYCKNELLKAMNNICK